MRRVGLVVLVLVLMGVSGVLGGWLNRGTSDDELDRTNRTRTSVGSAPHFELTPKQVGQALLVENFAGDVVYDLTAATPDTNVRIEHGFGDVTVIAPEDVGVRLYGRNDGLGKWSLSGFRQVGAYLVNDAFEEGGDNAEVLLLRGTGSVRVLTARPHMNAEQTAR